MKKGIVIGASRDAIHTIKKAREKGIYVVALDGNPNAEGFKFANESIVVDISDWDKTSNEVARIKPDFTIPIPIGRYLSTMGYINDKFQLEGACYEATRLSTDKYVFHKKLNEENLRNVQLYLIDENTKLDEIKMEYPAILKPRFGSGSRDVYFLKSKDDLKEIFEQIKKMKEDFVLEQAVDGDEYGVDGAVINGKLQITLLRKKVITPLPVRQAVASFAETNMKLYDAVRIFLQKVIETLNYNNCLVNADLIINKEQIFVIEAAPRPSGHNLHNVFVPLATDIDIAEEYIKFLLGAKYNFIPTRIEKIQIRFFDFNDVYVKYIPTLVQLKNKLGDSLVEWNCSIKENEYLGKVVNGHSIMGRGFFVVKGGTEGDLIEKSDWVLSQFGVMQRGEKDKK